MKKLILISLLCFGLPDKLNQTDVGNTKNLFPCEDERYLELSKIKLDRMTENEFRELIILSNNCEIYKNNQLLSDSLNQKIDKIEPRVIKRGLSLLWFLIIHNNIHKMK